MSAILSFGQLLLLILAGGLAFPSDREGDWHVYVMDADGLNERKLLGIAVTYESVGERVLSWTQ